MWNTWNVFMVMFLSIILLPMVYHLLIIWLSDYSSTCKKMYWWWFDRNTYASYKEVKNILKNGGNIPVHSIFTSPHETKGWYFIPIDGKPSLWEDENVIISSSECSDIMDELVELGNLHKTIDAVWESDKNRIMR